MAILPKEKPKSHKKKQSIKTLKKMKDFLEPESFEYIRKDLAKKYEHPVVSAVNEKKEAVISAVTEAASIVTEKHKKKIKNIWGGVKHTIDYLRSSKDKKFLGHTDNTKK